MTAAAHSCQFDYYKKTPRHGVTLCLFGRAITFTGLLGIVLAVSIAFFVSRDVVKLIRLIERVIQHVTREKPVPQTRTLPDSKRPTGPHNTHKHGPVQRTDSRKGEPDPTPLGRQRAQVVYRTDGASCPAWIATTNCASSFGRKTPQHSRPNRGSRGDRPDGSLLPANDLALRKRAGVVARGDF